MGACMGAKSSKLNKNRQRDPPVKMEPDDTTVSHGHPWTAADKNISPGRRSATLQHPAVSEQHSAPCQRPQPRPRAGRHRRTNSAEAPDGAPLSAFADSCTLPPGGSLDDNMAILPPSKFRVSYDNVWFRAVEPSRLMGLQNKAIPGALDRMEKTTPAYRGRSGDEGSLTRGQHVAKATLDKGWTISRAGRPSQGQAVNNNNNNEDKAPVTTPSSPPGPAPDPPIYAQVLRPIPNLTSAPQAAGPHRSKDMGGNQQTHLNYTDVIFTNPEEGDGLTFEDKKRQRKNYTVEYVEINPVPLPKCGAPNSKATTSTPKVPSANPSGGGARSQASVPSAQKGGVDCAAEADLTRDSRQPQPVPKPRSRVAKQPQLPNYENTQLPKRQVAFVRHIERATPKSPTLSPASTDAVTRNPGSPRNRRANNPTEQQLSTELSHIRLDPKPHSEARHLPQYENHEVVFNKDSHQTAIHDQQQQQSPIVAAVRMAAAKAGDMNFGSNLDQVMVKLPLAPTYPAPPLPPDSAMWWTPPYNSECNMIEASLGYVTSNTDVDSVMAFKKGDIAVLVKRIDPNGWFGVQMGERSGWVPGQYWAAYQPVPPPVHKTVQQRKMNIKQVEALHNNKAWFLGKISRKESETLLLEHGQQCSFLIRESTNRVGDLTLSMCHNHRVRHFPIQMTPTGKYDFGNALFTDLTNVVTYYQRNPLFYDELNNNAPVSLDQPINISKSS